MEKLIPFPDVRSTRVQFDLAFPPVVETKHIGIDAQYLEKLMNLEGIQSLIVYEGKGEKLSSYPQVIGLNSRGEAAAGKAQAKTVPVFSAWDEGSATQSLPHQYRFANGRVEVNMAQVSDRVVRGTGGVRSARGWSRELNSVLTQSISEIGTKNLLGPEADHDLVLAGLLSIFMYSGLQTVDTLSVSIPLITSALLLLSMFKLENQREIHKFGKDMLRHGSLFSGPQFDRAIYLKAQTAWERVVREIPSENPQKTR